MSTLDTRNDGRNSLYMFADLAIDGQPDSVRVKVRNLSPGGMMAEGGVAITTGSAVVATLRTIGAVVGSVAWVQGNRFGIAFANEIDVKQALLPEPSEHKEAPRYARPALSVRDFPGSGKPRPTG